MKNLHVLLILGVALAIVAWIARSGALARKNPGEPLSSAMRASMVTPQLSTEDALIISERFGTAHVTDSGLRYIVVAPGQGELPRAGQKVSVHYVGTLLDGRKFDSSRDRNEPFSYTIGQMRLIRGWDEAVAGMKKGERRTLIIPYWLGYGEDGKGDAIPPKATLIFDIELLSIE